MRCNDNWGRAEDRATHDSKRCFGKLSESKQDKLKRRAERLGTLTLQGGVRSLMPRLNKDPTDAMSAYHVKNQLRAQLAEPLPSKRAKNARMWAATPAIQTTPALPPDGISQPDIDDSTTQIALALPPGGDPQPDFDDPEPLDKDHPEIYMAYASENQQDSLALSDTNRNTTSAHVQGNSHGLTTVT